jgi:hypothetical protein
MKDEKIAQKDHRLLVNTYEGNQRALIRSLQMRGRSQLEGK